MKFEFPHLVDQELKFQPLFPLFQPPAGPRPLFLDFGTTMVHVCRHNPSTSFRLVSQAVLGLCDSSALRHASDNG